MAKKKIKNSKTYMDYNLLLAILFLTIFGIVMIYSASSYMANVKFGNSLFFVKKQVIFLCFGLFAMFIISFIDYKWYFNTYFIVFIYSSAVFLSFIVLFIGKVINGKRRWIQIGPLSFQPAEFVKIAVIFVITYIVIRYPKLINSIKGSILVSILIGVPTFFVTINNLSSGIIIFMIFFIMTFIATKNKVFHFMILLLIIFVTILAIVAAKFSILGDYRMRRILVWLNPQKYPMEGGYQVLQGLYAIGSGGMRGKGLGQSLQKFHLPEPHNDMIFAIIAEEFGFIGVTTITLIYIFILYRCKYISSKARDLAGSMIVIGIMSQIALQLMLNMAVVTNTIPNTGIGLPFVGYGGTSLVFLLAEIGLIFSVARRMGR